MELSLLSFRESLDVVLETCAGSTRLLSEYIKLVGFHYLLGVIFAVFDFSSIKAWNFDRKSRCKSSNVSDLLAIGLVMSLASVVLVEEDTSFQQGRLRLLGADR